MEYGRAGSCQRPGCGEKLQYRGMMTKRQRPMMPAVDFSGESLVFGRKCIYSGVKYMTGFVFHFKLAPLILIG
jgi:hypothetical protein